VQPGVTIGVVTRRQDREFLVYLLSVQLATWPMGWMSFIVLVGRLTMKLFWQQKTKRDC
jgi:hypothetical protein